MSVVHALWHELQGDEQGYPESIKALLAAAGVLDAVPFSPEPVFSGGSGELPAPKPLSYEWGDTGERADPFSVLCALPAVQSPSLHTLSRVQGSWKGAGQKGLATLLLSPLHNALDALMQIWRPTADGRELKQEVDQVCSRKHWRQCRCARVRCLRACPADFQDDGQELSQEDWEDFFQTQLQGIGEGPADRAKAWTKEDAGPDGASSGMPESFGDDFPRPGVRTSNHYSLLSSGHFCPDQLATSQRAGSKS